MKLRTLARSFWFWILLLAGMPSWSQTDSSAAGTSLGPMLTPPPVSGGAYSTDFTSEARSNYLRVGLTFTSAYSDNVYTGADGRAVADESYSVGPSIALDETLPRLHFMVSYNPGFTFYQHTSALNQSSQYVGVNFQYRLSPHVTLMLRDSLQKSSSILDQPGLPSSLSSVAGSPQAPLVAVIAPAAEELTNNGNATITYQFSASSMVGASGTFMNLHYPNPSQVPGLYDSNSSAGAGFYSRRLSARNYFGGIYQYSRMSSAITGGPIDAETHSAFVFYTIYLQPNLSFSISGGGQRVDFLQSPTSISPTWSPAGSASLGWQGRRTSFAGTYARVVTAGGGLAGTFHANTATATGRWQLARSLTAGITGAYSIYDTLTPLLVSSNAGGHTVSGSASIQRLFGQHLNALLGYTRIHQSYSGIEAVSTTPDINREFITLSYQFTRPLGR